MNWLDIVLLIVLAGSVVTSFSTGLAREVVGLISMIAALVQPYVSSPGIANFCGFLLVFCGVLVLGAILGRVMGRLMKVAGLSFVDRLLGAGFGLVRGLLISIAVVLALLAFTPGKSPPDSVVHSKVAPYVIDAARVCAATAPHGLKDGFHKSYEQVKTIWGNALKKGIRESPGAGKS